MKKTINYLKGQFNIVWGEVIKNTKKELKNADIIDGKIKYQDSSYEDIKDFYTKWQETWKEFLRQDISFTGLDEDEQHEIEEDGWIKEEFQKYL